MKSSIFVRILYVIIYCIPLFIGLKIGFGSIEYEEKIVFLLILSLLEINEIKEIVFSLKTKKIKKYLMENGKKVKVKIEKRTRERRSYVYCVGEWINPDTNKKYRFRSEEYIYSYKLKIPNKVDVYIDEFNPKKYYMALKENVVIKEEKKINKEKNKNQKNKYKLKLSCGVIINNIGQEDLITLVNNKVDFTIEKSKNDYLKVIILNEEYYIFVNKGKETYKYKTSSSSFIQKIIDSYYKDEKIEQLDYFTRDDAMQEDDNVQEYQYFLEDIRVEDNFLCFKADEADEEKKIEIANITKIVKITDLSYFTDINMLVITKDSKLLFTYTDEVEENKEFDLSQIYQIILSKSNLNDISIEGNIKVI